MSFNLQDYEDVQARVQRFQKLHPVGRIETHVEFFDANAGHVLVRASIYREHEDTQAAGIDYAFGDRSTFRTNMAQWYVEDTVSSAIGRALALVMETKNKPTKQNMERVEQPNKWEKKVENFVKESIPVEKPSDPWTIEQKDMPLPVADALAALNDGAKPEEIPMCPEHNLAGLPKTGNTRGKSWKKYECPQGWPNKCTWVQWMEIDKTGRWIPQRPRPTQGAIN